jgi:hypothetical protein
LVDKRLPIRKRHHPDAKLFVIHAEIAAGLHNDGFRGGFQNVLRHDADIIWTSPDILKTIEGEVMNGGAYAADVSLQSAIGPAAGTSATAATAATSAASAATATAATTGATPMGLGDK